MKRNKNKIKNKILLTIACIMLGVFLISACFLDMDSYVPFILMCISGLYLGFFAYANDFFEKYAERYFY